MINMGENTMREFDSILNDSETYGDKLAEFLKRKTAIKPQSNNPFVLGGFDVSIDIDVDLVKLPPKVESKDGKGNSASKQPLRELTSNAENIEENNERLPKADNNAPTLSPQKNEKTSPSTSATSPSNSINNRKSIRRSVPGSDRLRRVAIQRRSRSCGRRDLLQEFNNATLNNTAFVPAVSSTPASIRQDEGKEQVVAKVTAPEVAERQEANSLIERSSRRQAVTLSHESQVQRPSTPGSPAHRRTYTVEIGPEPGQLLLSPSKSRNSNHHLQNLSKLSQSNSLRSSQVLQPAHQSKIATPKQDILAPDTPARLQSQYLIEDQPEFVVPETQPQDLSNTSVVAPFVVVPLSCFSPSPLQTSVRQSPQRAHLTPSKPPVSATPAKTPTAASSSPSAQLPTVPQPKTAAVNVANRSQQTSCSPRYVQNLNDILTEDESDNERQVSTAPLNLAPKGGNRTRESRLRKTIQRQNSPAQLLDLHRSRNKNVVKRKTRKTVLNKPSKPAINGEQFAEELARMSNYEILDLRKRKSLGMLNAFNGNRRQQKIIDEHIELEIQRRNLDDSIPSSLPKNVSMAKTALTNESISVNPERNDSMQKKRITRELQQKQQQPSRSRHRESPVTSPVNESISSRSPAAPPADFRDRSQRKQRTLSQQDSSDHRQQRPTRDSSLLKTFENDPPMSPPPGFGECSLQEQQSIRHHENSQKQQKKEDHVRQSRTKERRTSLKINDHHRSPSPVPPPPNGFRDSLQRAESPVYDPPTTPHQQQQKMKNKSRSRIQSPIATFEYENVRTASPAAPPPQDFRDSIRHVERLSLSPKARQEKKQHSRSKVLSQKNNIETEFVRSASPIASPPNGFRGSLQHQNSQIHEKTSQHQQKQKKKDSPCIMESSKTMLEDENVRSASPAAPPPHGFGDSLHHEELLSPQHHRSLRQSESPIARLDNNTMSTTSSGTFRNNSMQTHKKNKVQIKKKEQASISTPYREHEKDDTALTDMPQLLVDVPPPIETNSIHIEERVQALHVETSTLTLDEVSVMKKVELIQTTPSTESLKNQKQQDQSLTQQTAVFKKPQKTAPKKKTSKAQRELNKLTVSQSIHMLDTNESIDDSNTSGVRKSKRGQVPLCNNFSTTMDDPFAFMRKKAESYEKSFAKKDKKRSASSDISNIVSNRPPLFSSTPVNSAHLNADNDITNSEPKQIKQKKNYFLTPINMDTLSGISPMSCIQEQSEEQDIQQSEPAPKKRGRPRKDGLSPNVGNQTNMSPEAMSDEPVLADAPTIKKRGRKKKIKESVQQQPKPDEPSSEAAIEEAVCNQESFQAPIEQPPPQEQQGDHFPLIGWLRGSTLPVCDEEDDHVNVQNDTLSIARANNLQFSNLDGIDYAFYHIGDSVKLGYMRFKPLQVRGAKKAKTSKLQFVVLHGGFLIESSSYQSNQNETPSEQFVLNAGDMVEIKKGSRYNITNRLNEVGVLLINRMG